MTSSYQNQNFPYYLTIYGKLTFLLSRILFELKILIGFICKTIMKIGNFQFGD